jgi:hypothetical protein
MTYTVSNSASKKSTGVLVCNPNMTRGSMRKPYCAVCFKAGKSVDVYTNHFTKSSLGADAIVVCPTILAAQCAYCKNTGHFKSVCPLLKEKENAGRNRAKVVVSKEKTQPQQKQQKQQNHQQSAFAVFEEYDSDSDDDETAEDVTVSTACSDETAVLPVTYASVCKMNPVKQSLPAFPFPRKCISHNWADNDYWTDDE